MRCNRILLTWCLAVGSCCVPLSLNAADNELSVSEQKAGWKLLFDGRSTKGWRNYKRDAISDGWKVQNGELIRADKGAGDILTTDQFDNFELSLEFKISPEGNSGIMFLVTEDGGAPWHSGPEIQIQDNVHGHDPQKAGWLYQLYKPAPDRATGEIPDACRPAGEWNHVQLRVTEAGCEINVNGIRYAQFQIGSEDWNRRVAASKFSQFPNFGKAKQGHICLQDHGNVVAFRNIKVRTLAADGTAPEPIDGTLAIQVVPAFPKIEWEGWSAGDDTGRIQPFRPIVVTHAGDDRLFVAEQWGVIYVVENRTATQGKIFLDIRDRVSYKDNENEEGLLGCAFHPQFAQNGQVYVYYTSKKSPHTSIISRFRVTKSDSGRAQADSEEELMRIEQPFWNHNGGTIEFGPDGYLYIGLGDGGSANDPYGNGQNLSTLLGSILRIDVNHRDGDRPYAIPKDNPFVGQADARPEIYAYGLRNVWRLGFDRETGQLWCGDVGQNLWEEINLIRKGGNYGWALREGMHAFGAQGSGPRADLIEPIWEYDHQVGKSITAGTVYRGRACPQLVGKYLYADYVTGKIWALKYDEQAGKVVSNEAIPTAKLPIITFGEDSQGELYFTIVSNDGRGIFKFAPAP